MLGKKIFLVSIQLLFFIVDIHAESTLFPELQFHGTEETLGKITNIILNKQKGAYLRFGDGDVNLSLGQHDALQPAQYKLMLEMQEAFLLNGPTILKTLPLYCRELHGYEEGMSPGNHEAPYEWCLDILHRVSPLWGSTITDVYSHAALHFASSHKQDLCIQFLKFLKKSPCYILVGNENIPKEIRDLLFGENCIFIPTPSRQSYGAIDQVEQECLKIMKNTNDYKVIITAMGCSGRALQKRLWEKLDNVFLFDFGSVMDAICGWNTRAWIEITQFDEKTFINNLTRNIHVVCTAALINSDFENRKQEYIKTLKILDEYGYSNPYIFEAVQPFGPTFLNDYSSHVIYPNVNNPSLRNKGVNEARLLAASLTNLPFQDNDIIIKITGRYFFTSNAFLKIVEDNPTIDAFVKKAPDGQIYTGCYAMRYKFFKEMLGQLNLTQMEQEMRNIEQEVATYLKKIIETQNAKIMYLDTLDLTATIFGEGNRIRIQL